MMLGWFWSTGIMDANGQLTPIDKMGFQDVTLLPL